MKRYDALITDLRSAAQPERSAPADFAAYLNKVRSHAYEVTDCDVEELKAPVTRRTRSSNRLSL